MFESVYGSRIGRLQIILELGGLLGISQISRGSPRLVGLLAYIFP